MVTEEMSLNEYVAKKKGTIRYATCDEHGWRYAGFRTDLVVDAEGGSADTHVLVSITSPFDAAYVFERRSSDPEVAWAYVWSKFPQVADHHQDGVRRLFELLTRRKVIG